MNLMQTRKNGHTNISHSFLANDIDNAEKKAALLSVIGHVMYKVLQNLLAPDKPGDKAHTKVGSTS